MRIRKYACLYDFDIPSFTNADYEPLSEML